MDISTQATEKKGISAETERKLKPVTLTSGFGTETKKASDSGFTASLLAGILMPLFFCSLSLLLFFLLTERETALPAVLPRNYLVPILSTVSYLLTEWRLHETGRSSTVFDLSYFFTYSLLLFGGMVFARRFPFFLPYVYEEEQYRTVLVHCFFSLALFLIFLLVGRLVFEFACYLKKYIR